MVLSQRNAILPVQPLEPVRAVFCQLRAAALAAIRLTMLGGQILLVGLSFNGLDTVHKTRPAHMGFGLVSPSPC